MLMPEKIQGHLKWTNIGKSLVLSNGGIVVAQWDPGVRKGFKGFVGVYGEPSGQTFSYKTWKGWKDKIRETYHKVPPASYRS